MGLAVAMSLNFYASVAKGLNLKVTKFWGLIPTFVKVTGGKLTGGGVFAPPPPPLPPILNRVKADPKSFLNIKNFIAMLLIDP